jgi:hypothetical protein
MYYGDDGSSDGDGVDDKTMMVVLIKMMVCESIKMMKVAMDGWMDG